MAVIVHQNQILGNSAVTSFNNRSGSIIPITGDYNDSQIILSSVLHIGGQTQTDVQEALVALRDNGGGTPVTYPLATDKGGTGNNAGVIQRGKMAGTSVGYLATIEGMDNTGTANYSHTEGRDNTSSGSQSHTEGRGNTASGQGAHAEGYNCLAAGDYSHAEGYQNRANYEHQSVCGQLNDNKATTLFEVGNGAGQTRSNAFEVYANGDINVNGNIRMNGSILPIGGVIGEWTSPQSCAVGATSVVFNPTTVTSNSTIKVITSTASGKPIPWESVTLTGTNTVTVTFPSALTEAGSVRLQVLNV